MIILNNCYTLHCVKGNLTLFLKHLDFKKWKGMEIERSRDMMRGLSEHDFHSKLAKTRVLPQD